MGEEAIENNKEQRVFLIFSFLIIFLVALISGVYWFTAKDRSAYQGPMEKVSISLSSTSFLPALVHVANHNKYFLDEGLDVEIVGYSAGRFAFQAMLDGEVDIATVSDPNVVSQSFKRDDFKVFSTIVDSANHAKALARVDSGIQTPNDLIGKRIATTKGTTASYFLISFFIFHGLDINKVEVVDLKPGEMVDALVTKNVDAIFTWEPNILKAQEKLGKSAILLPSEVGYKATFSLAAKDSFVKDNPELLKRLLQSLIKAEEYMREYRKESIEILSSATGAKKQHVDMLFDNYLFRLSLSQSLISSLENQARWEISNNDSYQGSHMPNYLDYFVLDILNKVKPESVTIIQ